MPAAFLYSIVTVAVVVVVMMPQRVSSFAMPLAIPHNSNININTASRRSSPPLPSLSSSSSSTALRMEVVEYDVAIIGGGPAGCACALYTSRADLSTIILDKNPSVGALAVTSHIANYPGVDGSMAGSELLDQMRIQAVQYGTRYERAQVFMMDIEETTAEEGSTAYNKVVYTPDLTVKARSLVLATGAMGRASPPFPGEAEYLGKGVSYCATCDGAFYRESEVCVFGATNEAVEEALFLTKFASTVHWITSTDVTSCDEPQVECNKFLEKELVFELLEQPNVKHWEKTKLVSVEGDVSGVTGVTVKAVGSSPDSPQVIPVEGAFIYGAGGGSKPIVDFCQNKVDLDESGGVIVDRDSMESSVKGIFAIGDIRNTAYKQVVVAAADGCMAAMSIEKFLKNRKTVKVDWIHK